MQNFIFSVFPRENFVDLGLYQFGWEQCAPSHSFGPAARNHYLFHYVISGTGKLMADDSKGITQTYQIKSGQGFMLFPDQISSGNAMIFRKTLSIQEIRLVKKIIFNSICTPETKINPRESP